MFNRSTRSRIWLPLALIAALAGVQAWAGRGDASETGQVCLSGTCGVDERLLHSSR